MTTKPKINNELENAKNDFIQRRILTVVFAALLSLVSFFLVSDYLSTLKHAEELTLERLEGIVQHLSRSIDPIQHQKITAKFQAKDEIVNIDQCKDYRYMHEVLKRSYISHNLSSPIYTFIKGKGNSDFSFIATSSEEPYFRHSYTSFPQSVIDQLDKGGKIGLYTDEFGHWISAFAPIKTQDGSVIAYVQADEKFDDFIAQVRKTCLYNGLISLMGFAVVIVLMLPYLKKLLETEARNKELLTTSLAERQILTERLEANEQRLKQNAHKLEQSNKDLTDFAHIASHDLKAPIRNIASFSQLILRKTKGQLDDGVKEYFNFILQNTDRAQKLIAGLLSYSTADKNIGAPVEFAMHMVAEMAKQNLSSIISERKVKIEIEEMPIIHANKTLVSQVLQNLVNNGLKYNISDQPTVSIGSGFSPEKGTYFYVKDNGIGIAEKYQEEIFKMFTRLHGNGEFEGSGIGLAFCKRVVETYEGKMWLESEENVGSTFYFTLPKAMSAVEEAVLV